jgi:aminomethyltransferase
MAMVTTQLKRTSLFALHQAAGARMVEFGGWEMPVQYAGIGDEHRAVRTAAGVFDVSHMGEIEISGPGALDSVQRLIPNDASRLAVGQGLYSPMCAPSGGIIDDLTVFRLGDTRFLLIVNAAGADRDFAWIAEHTRAATARNRSAELALVALQGPKAAVILQALTTADLSTLRYFHAVENVQLAALRCLVSRTGYTGEDGFEIACAWDAAATLWTALLDAGRRHGAVPVGLGARDTLRLEAGYMLYGNDIDESTTPLEAPLSWTVKFEKGEFIGRDALLAQKARGIERKFTGLEMTDRAVPRHGYDLVAGGRRAGRVTSGTFGPWVNKSIGMGYLSRELVHPGASIQVEIRGRLLDARLVKLPFYQRATG